MKIYTKTGDQGKTSLIGGTRVLKNDRRIEAYGTVDELNSFIGLLNSYESDPQTKSSLEFVQNKLFVIGSFLATDQSRTHIHDSSVIAPGDIERLELEIDRMSDTLPELRQFILPGGSTEAGVAHVCRTIARRAERRILDLSELYDVDQRVLMYVNRLSDYFFVLSRYFLKSKGIEEIYWKK